MLLNMKQSLFLKQIKRKKKTNFCNDCWFNNIRFEVKQNNGYFLLYMNYLPNFAMSWCWFGIK